MRRSLKQLTAHQVAMLLLFVCVTLVTWRMGASESNHQFSTVVGTVLGLLGLAAPFAPRGTSPRWAALLLGGAMLLSAAALLGWLPVSPGFTSIILTSVLVVCLLGVSHRPSH
jgi:hypothetical protein